MNALDQFLSDNRITNKAFGEKIGMAESTVWRLRRGAQTVTDKTMKRIYEVTGGAVTPNALVGCAPAHVRSEKGAIQGEAWR